MYDPKKFQFLGDVMMVNGVHARDHSRMSKIDIQLITVSCILTETLAWDLELSKQFSCVLNLGLEGASQRSLDPTEESAQHKSYQKINIGI